ncbi:MAG: hypothetical protein WCF63_00965 [Acidimicrobiales bacterium]
MIRAIAILLAGGLLLSACGTQSMSTAMKTWTRESTYGANNKTLLGDVQHSATALRVANEGVNDLHTVCGVLLMESEQANGALPTPDALVNTLLSKAYGNLGAGANVCYRSGNDPAKRARALRFLSQGVAQLAEASARIRSDLTP